MLSWPNSTGFGANAPFSIMPWAGGPTKPGRAFETRSGRLRPLSPSALIAEPSEAAMAMNKPQGCKRLPGSYSAPGPRTVADTGILVRLIPAAEEQDRARAIIAAYADLAARWEHLCNRLSVELERSDRARCETPEGERAG